MKSEERRPLYTVVMAVEGQERGRIFTIRADNAHRALNQVIRMAWLLGLIDKPGKRQWIAICEESGRDDDRQRV